MEKETLAKHLKRYHYGATNAVTSRALEREFSVKGKELRDTVNALRRDGVPIASSGEGYFYAATEQSVYIKSREQEQELAQRTMTMGQTM